MGNISFYCFAFHLDPSRAYSSCFEFSPQYNYFHNLSICGRSYTHINLCSCIHGFFCVKCFLICLFHCFLFFAIRILITDIKHPVLFIQRWLFPLFRLYIFKSMFCSVFHSKHKIVDFFFCCAFFCICFFCVCFFCIGLICFGFFCFFYCFCNLSSFHIHSCCIFHSYIASLKILHSSCCFLLCCSILCCKSHCRCSCNNCYCKYQTQNRFHHSSSHFIFLLISLCCRSDPPVSHHL